MSTDGPAHLPRFPDVAFFEAVREATNVDPAFRRATEWFDGSVLLRLGEEQIWMKWYRGQIIDLQQGPSPLGYTFSLEAPLSVWEEIWTLPRQSYRPWAQLIHYGRIATAGSLIEANRVTEAVYAFVSHIHRLGEGTR